MLNTTAVTTFNYSQDNPKNPEGCIIVTVTAKFLPYDNPHNLIKRPTADAWERIINGIFLPILFLINTSTNSMNMMVFYKQGLKERINLCLFFLSLSDFIYVAQAFCMHADRIYLELTHQPIRGDLVRFFMNNNINTLYGFAWASSWITTIIACERCFCVLSPLRSQTVLKTKTMWFIILLPLMALVGGYYITTTKWHAVCAFYPANNFRDLIVYPSDFYLRNKDLVDKMEALIFGFFVPQFCMLTIIIATIITVIKLKSMAEWRDMSSSVSASSVSTRDIALTRMLVGTSVLYIVSFIPGVLLRVSMVFVKDLSVGGHYFNTFQVLTQTIMFLMFINASFNFFIYFSFGSKFRATLRALICRKVLRASRTSQNIKVQLFVS